MKAIYILFIFLLISSCNKEAVKPTIETINTAKPIVPLTDTIPVSNIENNPPSTLPSISMTEIKKDSIIASNGLQENEFQQSMTVSGITSVVGKTFKILALGDSYTIGEGVLPTQRYPSQLVDSLKKLGFDVAAPKIIARTGWRTDNLAAAIVANGDTSIYDFVFLLIGVNNFYQGRTSAEYAPQFEALLTTALGFAGNVNSHVFVLSIPDYGYTPFGQSQQATISAGIDIFNQINKGISLYKQVNYIDITDISRASDGGLVANDGLHPSAYQYKKWVERIIPIIEARMRD